MNYQFPIIRNISDVLPHIEGYEEIIVAERDGYKVVNYMVSTPRLWEREPGWEVRRECRGIIFDSVTGDLISRPFHKFFNANEKPETQLDQLDMSREHAIFDKIDGSMIRPLIIRGELFLATKMGITEIALEAQKLLTEKQIEWLRASVTCKTTPLFEYVAPTNKIVIHYEEPKLVYLGSRENLMGAYRFFDGAPFEVVPFRGHVTRDGINKFVDNVRLETEGEGYIVRFADGHMVKVKNDWYVRVHKTLDDVRADKNVLKLALNNELDDVIPMLPAEEVIRVESVVAEFWALFESKLNYLVHLVKHAEHEFGMDKKRIALEMQCPKEDKQFVFHAAVGRDLRTELLRKAEGALSTTTNLDQFRDFLRRV